MISKEALKSICLECEKAMGKNKVACPFRSISNEYCEEYENIKRDLDRLEKLEKDLKYISEQDFQIYRFPNGRIIFGVDITNCPSEQEKVKRILEEVLKNENFL